MEHQLQPITITDPTIIEFFNESLIDPSKFILLAIQYKHIFIKNTLITENSEETEKSEKLEFTKSEIYKIKQEYITYNERESEIKDKINELIEILDSQKLPFLEKKLIANNMLKQRMYKCNYCNVKSFLTKRALAGHTNHCRPLYETNDESNDEEQITETA
jgi:hypothetical protein